MNPFAQAVARRLTRQDPEVKQIRPTSLLPISKDNQPQFKTWDVEKAIKEGFKVSVWVYACVNALMKASGSVPWSAEVKRGKIWEPDPTHPLTNLMENPNEFMSRQDVIERKVSHLYLGGNGLLMKIRAGGTVAELWPLSPSGVRVIPSKTQFISGYQFERDGVKPPPFAPRDIIHCMFTDPSDPRWGMAPLQAAARTVDTDVEAVKWNKVSLQNRALPDGVFSFKTAMTPDQWEEARETVRREYLAEDSARTPWVLGAGADWKQMSLSPAEMDFIKSRGFHREEICSVFGVPLVLVAHQPTALANIATARRIFWEDTVIPLLEDLAGAYQRTLVPEFGDRETLRLRFDVSNVAALQRNYGDLIETAEKMHRMGTPLKEINRRLNLGLEEFEGWEQAYIPSTMMPVGDDGRAGDELD